MATPLRRDLPEEEPGELTTADIAEAQRPVTEPKGPQSVSGKLTAERSQDRPAEDVLPLFPNEELETLRSRWKEVQGTFVDQPRVAVEQADGLVASAMKRLAEMFAEERLKLEQQWDRGDNVSTEDLRVALQRYRTFFHRLLSV